MASEGDGTLLGRLKKNLSDETFRAGAAGRDSAGAGASGSAQNHQRTAKRELTMADNYLENHYEDYLKRKAAWEKSRKHGIKPRPSAPEQPDDEAL